MGFFGGKKDKNKDLEKDNSGEGTSSSPKKSRRIVAPGAPGAPAAPAAKGPNPAQSAAPSGAAGGTAIVKPMAPRPPQPAAPRPVSDRVMKQPSAPAETAMITAPPRPKGKDPITVGSSKPPEFTGGLAQAGRRSDGPCRTGDAALLDFLKNKAKLLDEDQVGHVRGKAEMSSLQIDVAAVELGFITEEQMVNALTQECWVPHLKVDKYEIRKKALDTITREDATHYGVFPVDKLGSLLTLAMVNPLDAETIRVLENKTGLDIKKVVATRSEISQGIEKYYSGQVQAKDTSISFTQDVEPKSVTQMMSKVAPSSQPPLVPPRVPPSRPMPAITAPSAPSMPQSVADNIVPEIQDIDDLLSSDEAIAPAIIEPISLKAEAFEAVPVEPIEMEPLEFEPVASAPIPRPSLSRSQQSGEFAVGDALVNDEDTLTKKSATPAAAIPAAQPVAQFEMDDGIPAPAIMAPAAHHAPAPLAPEFDIDHGDEPVVAAPAAKAPASAAVKPPAVPAAPAALIPPPAVNKPTAAPAAAAIPPPPVAPARAVPPPARPPTQSFKKSDAAKPATSRFAGTGRAERSGIVNLIPVTEDEFQHAITHGKSHVFEKWVGLQSRNRIINAVSVEAEFDDLLESLYAGAVAV
jgi:Type II secretion system (T2SS), protein E, N-terminal domain